MSFFNGTVLKKIIQARHGDGVFRPILSIGGSAAAPYCPTSLMMAKGVYSGSAIEINNRLCLYYTGNARRNGR